MSSHAPSYHGYRFPSEIISHAVWLIARSWTLRKTLAELGFPELQGFFAT